MNDVWVEERRVERVAQTVEQANGIALAKAQLAIDTLYDEKRQAVYHDLIETLLDDYITTRPEESDKREEIYHQINGLRSMRDRLIYWLNVGARINPKLWDLVPEEHRIEIDGKRSDTSE